MNKTKQVIIMRKDLNMRKGKMIAQGAHVSMKVLLDSGSPQNGYYQFPMTKDVSDWLSGKFTKVCLSCSSEEELDELYEKAKRKGLLSSMIIDSGLTEFNNIPTKTCIAIGPADSDIINEITGDLKLL